MSCHVGLKGQTSKNVVIMLYLQYIVYVEQMRELSPDSNSFTYHSNQHTVEKLADKTCSLTKVNVACIVM